MMYDLKSLRPDLIDSSEKRVVLMSSNKISFKYDKLWSDLYVKSPYVRGSQYWKQLPADIQHAATKSEFKSLITYALLTSLKN